MAPGNAEYKPAGKRRAPAARCPQCGQVVSTKCAPVRAVKRYALETRFGVRRVNGGFI